MSAPIDLGAGGRAARDGEGGIFLYLMDFVRLGAFGAIENRANGECCGAN